MSLDHLRLPSGCVLDTSWALGATADAIEQEVSLVNVYIHRLRTMHNRRNLLLRLAPELLELIFDELEVQLEDAWVDTHNLKTTMQSCALVCSALLPFARRRLFSFARLRRQLDTEHAFELARAAPELFGLARRLELRETALHGDDHNRHWGTSPRAADVLSTLRQVKELEVVMMVGKFVAPQTPAKDAMVRLLSQITQLKLQGFEGTLSSLYSILLCCPLLRSLALIDCRITSRGEFGSQPTTRLSLHSLRVEFRNLSPHGREYDQFLIPWLCDLIHPETLRSLLYVLPDKEWETPATSLSTMILHIESAVGT
jgi:hypothetical protein